MESGNDVVSNEEDRLNVFLEDLVNDKRAAGEGKRLLNKRRLGGYM